jgi:hypothetical protein
MEYPPENEIDVALRRRIRPMRAQLLLVVFRSAEVSSLLGEALSRFHQPTWLN